jgi:hypothetical protein
MIPDRMLPDRATVSTRVENVIGGRLVETVSVRAANQPARYVPRDRQNLVYDAAGTVIVDGDLTIRTDVRLGDRIDLDNGTAYIVSAVPYARRRGAGGPVFYSAPVKDVTP